MAEAICDAKRVDCKTHFTFMAGIVPALEAASCGYDTVPVSPTKELAACVDKAFAGADTASVGALVAALADRPMRLSDFYAVVERGLVAYDPDAPLDDNLVFRRPLPRSRPDPSA